MAWLPKLKIAQKLPLAMVGCAVLVGVGVGAAAYTIGLETVLAQRQDGLKAAATSGFNLVTDYFKATQGDLTLTAARPDTANAIENFNIAFHALGADVAAILQGSYTPKSPAKALKPPKPSDGSMAPLDYDSLHRRTDAAFRTLAKARDYADVLLLDATGNVIYSVAKNTDFGTNVGSGPGASTSLGAAYAAALKVPDGSVAYGDFTAYAPAGGQPESFMAAPVFDNSQIVGVIAYEIPTVGLTNKLGSVRGMGKTGEVMLAGKDGLLRSDSIFTPGDDGLKTSLGQDVLDAAASGAVSPGGPGGYRQMPLMARAVPFIFKGAAWSVVAVQAEDEVLAPVTEMRNTMLVVGTGLVIVAAILGLLFSRGLTKPISRLTKTMGGLADGELTLEVQGTKRRDEIGAMARAVEVFKRNALRVEEMTESERANDERRRAERAEMLQELQRAFGVVVDAAAAGNFSRRVDTAFPDEELNALAGSLNSLCETVDRGLAETSSVMAALARTDLTQRVEGEYEGAFARLKDDTNAVAEKLGEIVSGLQQTSRQLKAATGEILSGANDLSERTTRQAATIEETSAAMEQLSSTVLKNAERAKDASDASAGVTRTAEEGGQVMQRVTDAMERITGSSAKISNIIGFIDDIAFQTNLLALNASVEAARAGEAGKGFAVVAVEVRRLAQSAAQASSEVKALIQQSGDEVRGGSKFVAEAAHKLEAMVNAARSSHGAMLSIAKDSQDQAHAIEEVNAAVRQMDEMTQHNAALVEETNAAIEQTEAQAVALDRIVAVFHLGEQQAAPEPRRQQRQEPASGIRGLQQRVRAAARSYLSSGSAALEHDFTEF